MNECEKTESNEEQSTITVPGNGWRQDVQLELATLTERIVRLRRFMLTDKFYGELSEQQANLLRNQGSVMCQYADILTIRLQAGN